MGVVFCIKLMWCQLAINTNVLPFSVNVWFDSAVNMQALCACTQGGCWGPWLVLHEINSKLMAELEGHHWRSMKLPIFWVNLLQFQISCATDMPNTTYLLLMSYMSWVYFKNCCVLWMLFQIACQMLVICSSNSVKMPFPCWITLYGGQVAAGPIKSNTMVWNNDEAES